jgi:hypothetical protein
MTSITKYMDEIDKLESDLITQMDEIFIKAGMEAFVLWATAFPKRDLRFVSGMGTATFACPTLDRSCFLLDLDDYCEGNTRKSYWSPRAAAMVQPMREFWELFWCGDFYKYPSIPDIIYDSKRRTVECGDNIIQLDEDQA